MPLGRNIGLAVGIIVLAPALGPGVRGAGKADSSRLTIGGVVYTDVRNPVYSGAAGVAVEVQGEHSRYEAVTAGVLGLWKMEVPPGAYTVTPRKAGYALEHVVRGWCDGQHALTIEVSPRNLAANQSIQFLAIYWPDPNAPAASAVAATPAETAPAAHPATPRAERTGGGCAVAPGRRGDIGGSCFSGLACVGGFWITGRRAAARRSHRRK